jgi:coenzyme F420-reducing hydrogenase beta subunit
MDKEYSPKEIVHSGLCIGCGSCVAQQEKEEARMSFDSYGQLKPIGNKDWYNTKARTFTRICPFSPRSWNEDQLAANLYPAALHINPFIGRFQEAYVGYASEDNFRMEGSSGGMVTWVATELLRKGMVDGIAHVIATDNPAEEGRYFKYTISRSVEDIKAGAKSRYYPVEMSGILNSIKNVPGRYAVIGIPCFIKAVHLLRREDPLFRERIKYTLGLFCGHMKSARFVESFAWQMNVPVHKVQQVEFRKKYPDRPANWYNAKLTLKNGIEVNRDWFHLADGDWGAGFFMNHACNYCDDVVAETADISFGDAWVEPYSSDGKGTNVVIVRSDEMQHLITNGINTNRLNLQAVDSSFVERTQAAGFRQRREGLSYRLTWSRRGVQPIKRVSPNARLTLKRKVIYRMRYYISLCSHRVFWLARMINLPNLYIIWAGITANIYHGFAYHQGKLGSWIKKFVDKPLEH